MQMRKCYFYVDDDLATKTTITADAIFAIVSDQAFQMRHQPFALISPDTDLQAFGEINNLQLAQF
jgi:hypothetical protein